MSTELSFLHKFPLQFPAYPSPNIIPLYFCSYDIKFLLQFPSRARFVIHARDAKLNLFRDRKHDLETLKKLHFLTSHNDAP